MTNAFIIYMSWFALWLVSLCFAYPRCLYLLSGMLLVRSCEAYFKFVKTLGPHAALVRLSTCMLTCPYGSCPTSLLLSSSFGLLSEMPVCMNSLRSPEDARAKTRSVWRPIDQKETPIEASPSLDAVIILTSSYYPLVP